MISRIEYRRCSVCKRLAVQVIGDVIDPIQIAQPFVCSACRSKQAKAAFEELRKSETEF